MTKQQTVELLEQQLPGFYSVEQVIKMINDIEESDQVQTYSEDQVNELISDIESAIERRIERMDSDDLVELSSAEFELYGNEIQLSNIEVNNCTISGECGEIIRERLLAFIKVPQPQEAV
jgi:hypothetical protein